MLDTFAAADEIHEATPLPLMLEERDDLRDMLIEVEALVPATARESFLEMGLYNRVLGVMAEYFAADITLSITEGFALVVPCMHYSKRVREKYPLHLDEADLDVLERLVTRSQMSLVLPEQVAV